jgi:hypothetical protein
MGDLTALLTPNAEFITEDFPTPDYEQSNLNQNSHVYGLVWIYNLAYHQNSKAGGAL